MPDPVDYRAPTTDLPHPKRSPGTWLILNIVWMLRIAVWGLYLALAAVLVIRLL
jgi:hypothetical protein